MTIKISYPDLYQSADSGSNTAQRFHLWIVRSEYGLLFAISTVIAYVGINNASRSLITIILVLLSGILVFKVVKGPVQDWYRCRALAESIKTTTWRFVMRSQPFNDADFSHEPKADFRNYLNDILKANSSLAKIFPAVGTDQVTESMLSIRAMPLNERMSIYKNQRIADQRKWYVVRSASNKTASKRWMVATIGMYLFAVFCINSPGLGLDASWMFDPAIVLVTSIIGWTQIKRHSEFAASYGLTAHEIGILSSRMPEITTEMDWSEFVNEAELAFSREHTQWVARRDAQ